MSDVIVETSARLHFGFLNLSIDRDRLFGSLGVAIDRPHTVIEASSAPKTTVNGDIEPSIEDYVNDVCSLLSVNGVDVMEHNSLSDWQQRLLPFTTSISNVESSHYDWGEGNAQV